MSGLLKRNSKISATTLRGVPENTKDEARLHFRQQDTATQHPLSADDGSSPLSAGATAPAPSRSATIWCKPRRKRKRNPSIDVETGVNPIAEKTLTSSRTSLTGAIGSYKHAKIQWRRKNHGSLGSHEKNITSRKKYLSSKPRIKVAIPCGKPLPALPFFDTPPTKLGSNHQVSPPSASHNRMRDSILSPLAQSHAQRMASQITPRSERHTAKHPESSLESSSSHNESQESDASSLHSNRSSETSVENDTSQTQAKSSNSSVYLPKRQIVVPGGTLYSSPRITTKLAVDRSQCHAPPTVPPRTYVHRTSSEEDPVYQPTCALHTTQRKPRLNRKSSKRRGPRENLTADAGMAMISEAIPFASGALPTLTRTSSPTLSEAECDLHAQLASSFGSNSDPRANVQNRTSLAECNPVRQSVHEPLPEGGEWIDIKSQPRRDSATVVLPDTPPPVLPRKSSKRQLAARRSIEVDRLPRDHIASQMMQRCSRSSTTLTLMIPQYKKRSSVDLVFSPLSIATNNTKPTITPAGAEKVILGIFRHLDHFNDLFAAAFINQGFYRVFKRHELELLKSTLRNMSPPAWEFREIAFPRHDLLHAEDLEMTRPEEEYTPASYLKLHKEDIQVIRTIKSEILEKCQSFVRPEISAALMSTCPAESARVDDALWRIWTFCKIFGSGKGREEDIVAQMDWLNGGVLVHQATCTFSIMSTDFMSDTLVGAPECFGQGNGGGLNAEQLFDMMELWTCLSVLLQNFEGRTVQARQAGIYDNTDIRGGDIDGEEMMLDEWIYHLLTFGLATVVKLTGPYHPSDPKAFDIAAENGWVNWKPPVLNGTRQHFLKEAARRVYEDKIAHTYAKISIRDVQRQQSKIRIQKHINELQHRKKNGENRPTIRMSQERPMSEWDTVIRNLTRPPLPPQGPGNDIITHVPTLRSASAEEVAKSVPLPASWSTSSRTSSPPRRTVAQPLLPTPPSSTVPSNHDRRSVVSNLPSIGEQPPSLSRLTVAQLLSPSPSASAVQYNRDLYTMGSVSSVGSSPRRMYAQPLLPTPSTSTEPNSREWHRYSTGTFMPSILEDPLHHPISEPRGPPHPAFRPHPMSLHYRERHMHQGSQSSGSASSTSGSVQQNEQQHHMYGSRSHENTADKAIYRIVEMGFTAAEAREALRLTDLGNGLRVDRAVELLLSRQT